MKSHLLSGLQDLTNDLSTAGSEIGFDPFLLTSLTGHNGGSPSSNPPPAPTPSAPVLPDESAEAMAAVSGSGSGGPGSVVAEASSSGFTINLIFDAAAMAAPAGFRAGIEQAAAILSATITNKITVNLNIDYSGTGGGAAAGPDNGLFESYATVRSDLIANAAPGDTAFNALPSGSKIQGQSQVAVWNAQLKLFGLLGANDTTTDDGSATFATDINPNLLVGVALHELTHAIGRVPYGSQPDIFDFYRFTSPGTYLFSGSNTAPSAYFSLNGGTTKLADFGVSSDPSDFLNSGVQGGNDPFNEFYSGSTLQSLTTVDKQILDALGFNLNPPGLAVVGDTLQAVQDGANVLLLSSVAVNDPGSANLSSATIKIANGSGSAVAGDELFVITTGGPVQNGSVGNGVTASWNSTTGTLTLSGTANISVYDALLSEVSYTDTGTDTSSGSHPVRTVTWTINDGTNSYNATSQVTVDRAPVAANSSATDTVGATITATTAGGVLSNVSDLDSDSVTVTAVSDTAHGAGTVGTSLAGQYGHLTLNADGSYSYVADNTAAIGSGATGSHLQDVFTYTVSDGNSGTANASIAITIDRAPVVTATSVALSTGHTTVTASSLFSASDPDSDAITTYALENTGPGHFVLSGTVIEPNNQEIDVSAAQLSQLTYESVPGAGPDTVQVRVSDGTLWSNWTSFTVTAPAATIQTDGSTTLTQFNGDYFLAPTGGGTGPEITQGGVAVTPGAFKAIGAVQLAGGGYDVAWQEVGSNVFTIWSVDSQGHFLANIGNNLAGNSTTLENFETTFGQDLNGDGTIGPPPPPPPTTISTDGTTKLDQIGNNYFLDSTTGSAGAGPEITQGGVAVTPGAFKAIGAVQLAGGGYDVAWQEVGSNIFTIWSVDSQGHFLANIGNNLAGNSTTLENFETTFGQDLNGDGTIGPPPPPPPPPPTTISTDGTTKLDQIGNNYFLDSTTGSAGTGPEITQGGVAVTPGAFKAIGAVQLAGGGYDVAWQEVGSNVFTIWSVDSQGHFLANIGNNLAGNSTTLENFETTFGQDLNGDGTIGPPPPPPPTTISTDGTTKLDQIGNNYFLNSTTGSAGAGPEITQGGVAVTPGAFKAIGAVQLAGGGYDVAWQEVGSNIFTIWSVDSQGHFLANIGNNLAGNSTTLENFETTFGQDLNGDGTIGPPPPPPPTTISTDGTTKLDQIGNNYFLDSTTGSAGAGPEITQGGVAVTPGAFKAIGAVQLAGGGYDVAWQEVGSNIFTIWSVDSQGHFLANIGNNLAGNSTTLENFETTFGQDLNGDGTIGIPPATQPAATSSLQLHAGPLADNFQLVSVSGPVIESSTVAAPAAQSSAVTIAGHDVFVFAPNFGQVSIANFAPATDTIEVSKTVFANLQALLTATHDDASANAVITDAAHDTITLKGVTTAQLLAHQNDFHFI